MEINVHGPRPVAPGRTWSNRLTALASILAALPLVSARAQPVAHVIHISVDGLRPDAVTALGPSNAPNFYRLRAEGAFTDNARADFDYTVTLPDHTCQLTSHPVLGPWGHNWVGNTDPAPGQTLGSNNGAYVAGVFDVVHDHGLRTGLYAGKSKFSLFVSSWDATNGAPDTTGADDGRDKIDVSLITSDTAALVGAFLADAASTPFDYVFLHLSDPDPTGHANGWDITPGSAYSEAVRAMDGCLGMVLDLVGTNAAWSNSTAIILTADHGGFGFTHVDPTLPEDYIIPFYVWGPGVAPGAGLYSLNPSNRHDPRRDRVPYSDFVQPIRNGEAANLSLQLLGLDPVPGSVINRNQDLAVTHPSPRAFDLAADGRDILVHFNTATNALYDLEWTPDVAIGPWFQLSTNLPGTGGLLTNRDPGAARVPQRFYRLRVH